ncbi:hypothetical protein PYCC9005_005433 [Savitreella phatthalungensis]
MLRPVYARQPQESSDATFTRTASPIRPHHNTIRRASDPITIFSANDSLRAVLPTHEARGALYEEEQDQVQAPFALDNSYTEDDQDQEDDDESLDSVLEEVLDAVDEAAEMLARRRSAARIHQWLTHQDDARDRETIHDDNDTRREKRLRRDPAERRRKRRYADRIFRSLGVANVEQLLNEWHDISARDTAALRVGRSVPHTPWGLPQEQQDESAITSLLKYLWRVLRPELEVVEEEKPLQKSATDRKEPSSHVRPPSSVAASTAVRSVSTVRRDTTGRTSRSQLVARSVRSRCGGTTTASSVAASRSRCTRSVRASSHSLRGSHFWEVDSAGSLLMGV